MCWMEVSAMLLLAVSSMAAIDISDYSRHSNYYRDLQTPVLQTPVLRWERIDLPPNAAKPSPRKDFVFVYDEQKQNGVLFGGRTSNGNLLDDTWVFDIQQRRWEQVDKPIRPPARYGCVAGADQPDTSTRRAIVIAGGKGANGEVYNDVWGFDTTDRVWYSVNPTGDIPPPMYGAIGGIAPRAPAQESVLRLIMTYGTDDVQTFTDTWILTLQNTAINYTTVSATWKRIPTSDARPYARTQLGGTILAGDRIVLYGGCARNGWGSCPSNEAWVLSPNGATLTSDGSWKKLDSCPKPRLSSALVSRPDYDGPKPRAQAFMFGGYYRKGVGNSGEIAFLDADIGAWAILLPATVDGTYPEQRFGAGFISQYRSNLAILFGGESATLGPLNDLWYLWIYNDVKSSPNNINNAQYLGCYLPADLRITHGALMAVGFAILLPVSIFIARYLKPEQRKSTNPSADGPRIRNWWRWIHIIISLIGVALIVAGSIVAYNMEDETHLNTPHSYIGAIIVLLLFFLLLLSYFIPRSRQKKSSPTTSTDTLPSSTAGVADQATTIKNSLRQFKNVTRQAKRKAVGGERGGGREGKVTYQSAWCVIHMYVSLIVLYASLINVFLGMRLVSSISGTWHLIYGIYIFLLFFTYLILTLLGKPRRSWSVRMFRKLRGKKNGVRFAEEDSDEEGNRDMSDEGDVASYNEDGEADGEEDDLNRKEVIIMTIPKRRLTVVNA